MDTFEIHLENDNSLLEEIKNEINGVVIDTNEGPEFISNGLLVEETDDTTLLLQAYDVLCDTESNMETNPVFSIGAKRDSSTDLCLLPDENDVQPNYEIKNNAPSEHPLEGHLVQLENGSLGFLTFNSDIGCADQIVRLHDGSVGYVVSHSKLDFLRRKSMTDQHESFILVEVDSEESLLYALDEDVDCVVEEVETVDAISLDNKDIVDELQAMSNPAVVPGGSKKNDNLCTQCNKTFSSSHHLRVHERIHSGVRPFKCPIECCDKSFGTKYSRKAHIRTHTGEKPYRCKHEGCEKCFKTSGDLQKHIRTHTGEKPFLCSFPGCSRSFTTSNIRKVHIRTHTGEKPYICSQEGCDKSFASATNYRNHVRIHSGEKPYVCQFEDCDKRFTEYSSLYKHTLVHSNMRPYICEECPRSYRQLCTLNVHRRTSHGKMKAEKSSVSSVLDSLDTSSDQYEQIEISTLPSAFKEKV